MKDKSEKLNKELCIIPNVSANGIKFGESRQKVREAFGDFKEFKKTPFSDNTTDDFGLFHVFYNENDEFEAIEVFGDVLVVVDDVRVFPGNVESMIETLEGFVNEDGYYTNYEMSVGLAQNEDNTIESVLFGCKGYYSLE